MRVRLTAGPSSVMRLPLTVAFNSAAVLALLTTLPTRMLVPLTPVNVLLVTATVRSPLAPFCRTKPSLPIVDVRTSLLLSVSSMNEVPSALT